MARRAERETTDLREAAVRGDEGGRRNGTAAPAADDGRNGGRRANSVSGFPPFADAWGWRLALVVVVPLLGSALVFQERAIAELRSRLDRRSRALQVQLDEVSAERQALDGRLSRVETSTNAEPDATAVANRVLASVFSVRTPAGTGSAFAVSGGAGSSTLVTALHVVADVWSSDSHQVSVLQRDRSYEGTVTKVDVPTDLAILTIPASVATLTFDRSTPKVGSAVLVVGSPIGLSGTVSSGVVSALRTLNGKPYVQFSAPTSPGNSGGPVVDLKSQRVLGVVDIKVTTAGAENLTFAVPAAQACQAFTLC